MEPGQQAHPVRRPQEPPRGGRSLREDPPHRDGESRSRIPRRAVFPGQQVDHLHPPGQERDEHHLPVQPRRRQGVSGDRALVQQWKPDFQHGRQIPDLHLRPRPEPAVQQHRVELLLHEHVRRLYGHARQGHALPADRQGSGGEGRGGRAEGGSEGRAGQGRQARAGEGRQARRPEGREDRPGRHPGPHRQAPDQRPGLLQRRFQALVQRHARHACVRLRHGQGRRVHGRPDVHPERRQESDLLPGPRPVRGRPRPEGRPEGQGVLRRPRRDHRLQPGMAAAL